MSFIRYFWVVIGENWIRGFIIIERNDWDMVEGKVKDEIMIII